ncbi:MAG: MFS transporter [Ferrimicrobium sp.]
MSLSRGSSNPKGLRQLYVAVGFAAVGNGIVLPYLVVYLHLARHILLPEVGIILGVGAAVSFVTGISSGVILDRLRPIRVFQIAMAIAALGSLILSFVSSAPLALVAVLLIYIGTGIQWPSQNTLVGANVDEESASKVFAKIFLALNAGLGLGALIGASFVDLAHPSSFSLAYRIDASIIAAGIGVVEIAYRRGGLIDRRPVRIDTALAEPLTRNERGYRALLRDRAMMIFLLIDALLLLAGYAQLEGGWNAFAAIDVGVPARVLGLALTANTVVIVVAQLPVARVVSRMRRSRALALAAFVWLCAWGFSLIAVVDRRDPTVAAWLLIVAMGVFGLGETVYSPIIPAITNALAPEHLRGRYNAAANALWSMTSVVAPPIAAFLIATGNRYLWITAVLGTGVLVIAAVVAVLPRVLPRTVEVPPVVSL